MLGKPCDLCLRLIRLIELVLKVKVIRSGGVSEAVQESEKSGDGVRSGVSLAAADPCCHLNDESRSIHHCSNYNINEFLKIETETEAFSFFSHYHEKLYAQHPIHWQRNHVPDAQEVDERPEDGSNEVDYHDEQEEVRRSSVRRAGQRHADNRDKL